MYGSYRGLTRASPTYAAGSEQDTDICVEYDPRFRPWYLKALGGQKNVVFVMDTSGQSYKYSSAMKLLGKTIVRTLVTDDIFMGVAISEKIKYFTKEKISPFQADK